MTPATANNDEPGEFQCPECGCRCTRSPTTGVEFGHQRYSSANSVRQIERCPRRPAACDTKRRNGLRKNTERAARGGLEGEP